MSGSYIFVYGTLRKSTGSCMAQILASYSEFVGEAIMQGILYKVDYYPGVIESDKTEDTVYGELYKILNENILLPLLDDYEECTEKFPHPHEYVRKVLPITLAGGESVTAWVYVYNREVAGLQRINRQNPILHTQQGTGVAGNH